MTNAIMPKTIWMARIFEILPDGDVDAVDGTARADLYIGCREKLIMMLLERLDWQWQAHVRRGTPGVWSRLPSLATATQRWWRRQI